MPEKTDEDFYEAHGRRWFKSGDIGQVERDGTLKIIDRKKDLVKLQVRTSFQFNTFQCYATFFLSQFGEYVSLGKVESCLKTCPVVENVCIYGESTKSYCVALVTPDAGGLKAMAAKFGKEGMSVEEMCMDR